MSPSEFSNPDIGLAMRRDQYRLRQRWQRLSRNQESADWDRWRQDLQQSMQLRSERQRRWHAPALDLTLPIAEQASAIQDAIRNHQVVIVCGETGSGKSTQLPLIAMQMGYGVAGMIGHTQPRRIAARSVAARLAEQLQSPLGQQVGFKIRFTEQTNPHTFVKVMTDGILLAETQSDRYLEQYEVLIIDEAHERSLNIDFILGLLKQLLPKRPDLKVIITSATMDTERFSEHFQGISGQFAPVIHVAGRTYPVDIVYAAAPANVESSSGLLDHEEDVHEQVIDACRQLMQRGPGDILVFLPTENEIRLIAKKMRGALLAAVSSGLEILPLYARLSLEQQNQVFRPHQHRRIVLATNVAESSLTVPGIHYVVDSGTARISRYAPRSKVQRLPIEPISQASANQRAGRCGRIAPGVCMRLYTREDFESRPAYTTPEIRRTNLAGTILQLLTLGLGDIDSFPLIDPPSPDLIRDGYKTLIELQALTADRKLTDLGRKLSRLPVDPRIARIIYAAIEQQCLTDILVIVAGLETQDSRVRPTEQAAQADQAHAQWDHADSDFMAMLQLWDWIHARRESLSKSQFRKALEQNFLSFTLVNQWQEVYRQLLSMIGDQAIRIGGRTNDYDAIHRSLLTGLLSSIAQRNERLDYQGAGGISFMIWPGSGILRSQKSQAAAPSGSARSPVKREKPPSLSAPDWIVASEILETTRRYGRTIAAIDPDWLEPLADHLVKRHHVDPHWSSKTQAAMVYENVTLFGLPIIARRRMAYAAIDPVASRRLLIEHGLLQYDLHPLPAFLTHNRGLLGSVVELAQKTRMRQLIVDDYQLQQFYERNLPSSIVDARSLRQMLKSTPELDKQLEFRWEDLGLADDVLAAADQLPDQVPIGNTTAKVTYRFTPGTEDDGPNLLVPAETVRQLDDSQLGWLIPGLHLERIVSLIRSLPKAIRRNLVPAPDVARRVQQQWQFGQGNFLNEVARQLGKIAGEPIPVDQFDLSKIEPHLLVNIQVVDETGKLVAQSRKLQELTPQFAKTGGEVAVEVSPWHRDGLQQWCWGELPERVTVQRGLAQVELYPTVIDRGDRVDLRLVETKELAEQNLVHGVARLLRLAHRKLVKSQVAWLPEWTMCQLRLASWVKSEPLADQMGDLMVRASLVEGQSSVRSENEYQRRNQMASGAISGIVVDIAKWFPQLAQAVHQAQLQIPELKRWPDVHRDIEQQLANLLSPKFLRETRWEWLQQFPRYLKAIGYRIEKLKSGGATADASSRLVVARHWQNYIDRLAIHQQQGWIDVELMTYRWLIEELRVSLFAQPLGTRQAVSDKRLDKQFEKVRR